eukprot:XP_019072529.1 PREDICTED: uncharacterized protein LOC109121752 isoform X3 [Vitis vinifera]
MDDYGSKLKYTQNENVFEVEEIFTNILLRLPVKSLLICKSVCKYWWSLICSRSFMNLHLIQSQENPTYVFHRYTLRGGNIHLLTKADGETTESFLPGCPGFYSKDLGETSTGIQNMIRKSCFLYQWHTQRVSSLAMDASILKSRTSIYFTLMAFMCSILAAIIIIISADQENNAI